SSRGFRGQVRQGARLKESRKTRLRRAFLESEFLAYVAQVAVEIPRISRESRRHGGWVFTTKCGLG
ncbi:MAG: hypothetical protein ACXVBV_19395, partial [Isosphaeraceae bacterium]